MKLALIVQSGPHQGAEFTATEAGIYRVGRAQDVHLRLADDQFVSRNHCELSLTPQGLFLTDLNSLHGVLVNKQKVSEACQLRDGDVLSIGKSQISVAIDGVEEPTALDEPVDAIQGFRLVREVIRNGDRSISLAFSVDKGTPVLLHQIDLQFASHAEKEKLAARLLREASINSLLNQYPGILGFRQQGISGDTVWFATEYIEANPVSQMVKKKRGLRGEDALNILAQCAETLNCMHHSGITHRNLCPDSFWIFQNFNQLKTYLVDLASAAWLTNMELIPITTSNGLSFQNNRFTAPEVFSDYRTADKRSDIYSLGAILYYLLSGISPYENVDEAGLISAVLTQPPDPLADETDQALAEIIQHAMAHSPEDRYESMDAFLRAIKAAQKACEPLSYASRKLANENATKNPIVFEMKIFLGESGWKLMVTRSDLDQTTVESFENPFSHQDWAALYKALRTQFGALPNSAFSAEQWQVLFRYRVAKELSGNTMDPPSRILLPILPEVVGKILFESILPVNSQARTAFINTLTRAQRESKSLQFQLVMSPDMSQSAAYPWELIYNQDHHLVPSGEVDLIRRIAFPRAISSFKLEKPLRVLFIAPRPRNQQQLPELEEQHAVSNGLLASGNLADISLQVLEQPQYPAFVQAMSKGSYQIVHFDGHGFFGYVCPICHTPYTILAQFCEKDKFPFADLKLQGYLVFEDENHLSQYVSAETLQTVFGSSQVQLVTLSSCYSGRISNENVFSGAGPSLIQVGVPAVVSMQQPIPVKEAVCFIRQFYETLVDSKDPGEAVRRGRQQIRTDWSNPGTWFIPVLYVRTQ